jgi:hypothetical protein
MERLLSIDNKIVYIVNGLHECDKIEANENLYILPSHWYVFSGDENYALELSSAKHVAKFIKNANVVCMANSREEEENYLKYIPREKVLFCNRHFNHGLLRNGERIYYPYNVDKVFDAIFLGGHNKMQEKLKYIKNLCIIDKYVMKPRVECSFYNTQVLSKKEINEYINKSKIGLMMSEVEGASWASLEYLLCGLPVISCKSKGGRDVFYNSNNSIIIDREGWYYCSPKEKEEYALHLNDIVTDTLKNFKFNPEIIRSEVLNVCETHKNYLVEKINSYFSTDNKSSIRSALDKSYTFIA